MTIVRRLAVWALLSIFFSSLLIFAYGWTFNETFGHRETVKSWFETSGAYGGFVEEIVSLSQSQAAENGETIDASVLQVAANSSFTPQLLQDSLESVLDGTYDWLESEQPDIYFSVDLTSAKNTFADNVTQFASLRVESLPVCMDQELSKEKFDPFSALCRPAFLEFELLADEFRQQIIEDEAFLPDPLIESSDITINKGGQGQSLSDTASFLPVGYTVSRHIPLLSGVGAFLSALLIMVIADSKRKGLFKIFRGFAFTSLLLGLFTFMTSQSTAWVDNLLAIDPAAQGFTERIVKPLIKTATQDISQWTFRFMTIYAVIAVIILAAYLYLFKIKKIDKQNSHENKKAAHKPFHNSLTDDKKKALEKAYRKRVAKGSKVYKKTSISKVDQD